MVWWLSNSSRRRWWGCVIRRIAGGSLIFHTMSVQSAARSACSRSLSRSPSFSASVFSFLPILHSAVSFQCFARVAAVQRNDGRRLWRLPYDKIFIVFQWSGSPLSCFFFLFVCLCVCVFVCGCCSALIPTYLFLSIPSTHFHWWKVLK